jgi:chaperonin cofactor prefoldin
MFINLIIHVVTRNKKKKQLRVEETKKEIQKKCNGPKKKTTN